MRVSGVREVRNNDNRMLLYYGDHFSRNTITVKIYFAIHALYNITRVDGEGLETKKRERKTRRFRFTIKRACPEIRLYAENYRRKLSRAL